MQIVSFIAFAANPPWPSGFADAGRWEPAMVLAVRESRQDAKRLISTVGVEP
jgi:hypothetical protein